ncbi:Crp/Fnr family transcriptional regulator [Lentzea pudingi]|uniref:Crp/Fnr family transcriptional regulator n=1 Tax=Lentzea pudingi TaxID=1789439 RepID=UPI001E34F6A7|nr:Crp/Fnr family transcriptional regulator [Lentzea pudingi]
MLGDVVNLWEMLTEAQRARFRAAGQPRHYPPGTVIMCEGDPGGWALVVTSGHVKVVAVTPGGYDAVLAVRGPGDVLGEMAVVDGSRRSASVIAIDEVAALWLSAKAFLGVVDDEPAVSAALVRIITARLRYANNRRSEFSDSTSAQRLAVLIAELATSYGVPHENGTLITLRLSQQDLAGLAATSREAVARALRSLRDEGLVTTGRRRLLVRDVGALRAQGRGQP